MTFQNFTATTGNEGACIVVSTGNTISNCVFKNIRTGAQTAFYGGFLRCAASTSNLTLNNCLFYNIQYISGGGESESFIGMRDSSYVSVTINSCTFALLSTETDSMRYLLRYTGDGTRTPTVTIKNCIVYNGSGGTFTYTSGLNPTNVVSYTDFYSVTSSPSGTGVITSDPLFISAGGTNFRLQPSSPCRGTGISI